MRKDKTVIHVSSWKGRKKEGGASLRAWSVNRARFVKWKGVAFSGKDHTGSPRDLTSLDPQFPTRISSSLLASCAKLETRCTVECYIVPRFIVSTFWNSNCNG